MGTLVPIFVSKITERMKKEFSENNPNRRPELQKICEYCGKSFGLLTIQGGTETTVKSVELKLQLKIR
jgi:hypothetical protein